MDTDGIIEKAKKLVCEMDTGGLVKQNLNEIPDYEFATRTRQIKTKIIRDGVKSMDKKINEMEADIIDIKVLHEDKVLVMYKEG